MFGCNRLDRAIRHAGNRPWRHRTWACSRQLDDGDGMHMIEPAAIVVSVSTGGP
jgi:hypothetical protein